MKRRISCFLTLTTLLAGATFGQSSSLDSLRRLFYKVEDDSLRLELTAQIATEFSFIQADSALAWAERGLTIANRLDNRDALGKSYYQLGIAARNKQDLPAAMEHFLQAIELFRSTGNEKWMIDTEYEMSVIYQKRGEFAAAKRYLDRFYQFYRKQEEPASIIFALNQYNLLFEQMQEPDSMLYYAKETLKAAERYGQRRYLAKIHNNLAATYLYQQDYANAKVHLREAARIGFGEDVSGHYFNLYTQADLYRSLGLIDSSIFLARQALGRARVFGDLAREAEMHQFLAQRYFEKGDYRNAYRALETYTQAQDSLTRLQYERNLSELSVEYETQKKEAQIAQQQLQLQRESNRRNLILFGALACVAAVAGLFFFLQNRQRHRQREAEIELRLKASEAQRLRELDQVKSNFFANISHEFRTPLTLLLGPLREMLNGTFQGDVRIYQRMMLRNGERLLELVNQLLDLSRLESGAMQLDRQAADLVAFARSVVFSFESWALRRQLFFQTNFPQRELCVLFDADKLEKILSNLLSNALKFTPEKGRVQFELRVIEETEAQVDVEIQVADTGPGIPARQLPHIFDRFYRGSSTTANESGPPLSPASASPTEVPEGIGAGIGLALTKELVELHGGSLQVESEAERGTCFRIRLPFQLAEPATAASDGPADTGRSAAPAMALRRAVDQRPILLMVEDNPDLRRYIKDRLGRDYQVAEAVDGRQGLALATELVPDLVLTDVMMPEMDGLALCRSLKEQDATSHVPVVMLTARSEQEDKLSGLSTGVDAYLTKPFDARELQLTVHNLIEQRRRLRQKFAERLAEPASRPDFASAAEAAFLQKIADIVEAHLDDEDFSIEDLGRSVGMSRSQLHRKVKAVTDQSPSAYVRSLRLQHAYRLLEQRAGNISEVAFQVGIPNLAYFSRSFSRQFGFPPSTLLQK